jgi:hypothetical protein
MSETPITAAEAPKTMTIPAAGKRYFGLGRSASYEAARRGELPVVNIGRKLFVPVAAIERKLAEAGASKAA